MGFFTKFFGTPTREDFARGVIKAFRAGSDETIAYDSATFALRIGDGTSPRLYNLGNFYNQFLREDRRDRDAFVHTLVERHMGGLPEMPATFDEARPRILPFLRNRCYFNFSRLGAIANGTDFPIRPFRLLGETVALGLVLDYPHSMAGVLHDQLEKWGVSEEEAFEVAMANLRVRSEGVFEPASPGVWVSTWQDTYDATRMLLPEMVASLPVRGRPVAMVPDRNLLVVTGDLDHEGLEMLATIAGQRVGEPHPISAIPFVLSEGEWEELHVEANHPAAPALALARLQMIATLYDNQKELLEAIAARTHDPVFIATFMAVQDKVTGELSSYSTWTEGLTTSLPKTDKVSFVAQRGPEPTILAYIPWPTLAEVMGDHMQTSGDYPPRYVVDTFPTREQFAAMGATL